VKTVWLSIDGTFSRRKDLFLLTEEKKILTARKFILADTRFSCLEFMSNKRIGLDIGATRMR
jgi:hypothetical protein